MAGDIGCVVLAAGSSARLGQPKALIKVGDGNLIGWLVSRLRAKGLDPLVVTNEDIIEEVTNSVDCRVIVNPEPEAGRTGTLQVGIVDRPGFSDSTLEALISSAATSCPTEGGKGGHPILLSAEDVARVIQSPPSTSLRDLIDPHRIEVSDSHLHLNVDRQEDLGWLTDAFSGL
jgi:molybdenum cofactor cytidylyltransferase